MPSKRKNKTIPLQHPSTIDNEVEEKPLVELSEEEQWRLVRESGVLKKLSADAAEREANLETSLSLGDEIFNAALLIIPFSSLLLLMEMYVARCCGVSVVDMLSTALFDNSTVKRRLWTIFWIEWSQEFQVCA